MQQLCGLENVKVENDPAATEQTEQCKYGHKTVTEEMTK